MNLHPFGNFEIKDQLDRLSIPMIFFGKIKAYQKKLIVKFAH
jgi:hypothetical protein